MKPNDAAPLLDALEAMHDGRGWRAGLELAYSTRDGQTIPTLRRHHGPLRIQRGLRPEGPAPWHQIVVHPPGGIASGDALRIDVRANPGAQVLLTSPGAAKWYRSRDRDSPLGTVGTWATQDIALAAAEGSALEWLPLETIVFDGTRARWRTRFDVAPGASLIAAELVCLGQPASDRPFDSGCVRWQTDIRRGERLLLTEQANLPGGHRLLSSPAGLGGWPAFGTLYAVAPDPSGTDKAVRDALRALDVPGEMAVTECDELTLVRWRGANAETGWRALRAAWAVLRPALTGREAVPPRIWAT